MNIFQAVVSLNVNLRAPLTISIYGELDLCLMVNQFHKMLRMASVGLQVFNITSKYVLQAYFLKSLIDRLMVNDVLLTNSTNPDSLLRLRFLV